MSFALVLLLAAVRDPCSADVARFCGGDGAANGGIERCLKRHESELSESCKRERARREEPRSGGHLPDACKEDAATLCPGVDAAGNGLARCLNRRRARLSQKCRDAFDAVRVDR